MSQRSDILPNSAVNTPELTSDLLEAMRQGRDIATTHPLHHFLSIHRFNTFLEASGSIPAQIRIFRRLCRIIRNELNRHRHQYQLLPIFPNSQEVTLREDFGTGNAELQAWSVLYHRYVRIELDLSLKQVSKIVNEPERTLHRRQLLGIHRLTFILNSNEVKARRQHRVLLLRNRLPRLPSSLLVGRDSLIQWAINLLTFGEYQQLIVFGTAGIGKTTFVHRVAGHLIENRQINDIGRIDSSISIYADLTNRIAGALELPSSDPTLITNYLHTVRCLLVFDNAQQLVDDTELFRQAQLLLGATRFIVTCRTLYHPYPNTPTLLLPDLNRDAVYELIERQTSISLYGSPNIDYETLYQMYGGNPGLLINGFISKNAFNANAGRVAMS